MFCFVVVSKGVGHCLRDLGGGYPHSISGLSTGGCVAIQKGELLFTHFAYSFLGGIHTLAGGVRAHFFRNEFMDAIYGWSYNMTSVEWCGRELDICRETTIDCNNYLREVCADAMLNLPTHKVGGPGCIVEIDESLFTCHKCLVGDEGVLHC